MKEQIQDSSSLLEWQSQKAKEEAQFKIVKLIEQANDVHIYNIASEIGRALRCGLPTGDLEKQLANETSRVKQACDALLGYEKKMHGYWLSERTDKVMADHAYERRLIKNQMK